MHLAPPITYRRGTSSAKADFVTFPTRYPERQVAVQSALLLALQQLGDTPEGGAPSVSVSLTTPHDVQLDKTSSKKVGKRIVCLDMGNSLDHLQDALFGKKSACVHKTLLKCRRLLIDEGHLHHILKPWGRASAVEQLLLASASMHGSRVLTFSVNFGDRRSTAGKPPADLLRSLRNQLSNLGRHGPLVVVVETDDRGREHLHGMLLTATPTRTVKGLLRRLGGSTRNYRFANLHQVKVEESRGCMGWCHYMLKDLVGLPNSEAKSSIYISTTAKGAARDTLATLRRVSQRRLYVTPERRGRANHYHAALVTDLLAIRFAA